MLIKPTIEEAEKYIDFAYELALDSTRSGYPTYTDGIKTKEDFSNNCHRGLTEDSCQVLLYLEDGKVSGWIQFFFEDGYLQTTIFNIAGSISKSLAEFTEYCAANFTGCVLYMGFPGDNREAINYLSKNGWSCEEQSYNNALFFKDYEPRPETGEVIKVTRGNFSDFRRIHEAVQGDMYWNADRLYDAIDEWEIYLYYENREPTAAIYCRDCGVMMEIFGVDFYDNIYQKKEFHALMAKVLNECKRHRKENVVFFGDDENQLDIIGLGFHCVGEYVLFTKNV